MDNRILAQLSPSAKTILNPGHPHHRRQPRHPGHGTFKIGTAMRTNHTASVLTAIAKQFQLKI
jgi:hypothetical protein